jgi:hypothetical protein
MSIRKAEFGCVPVPAKQNISRRMQSRRFWTKTQDPISKITNAK